MPPTGAVFGAGGLINSPPSAGLHPVTQRLREIARNVKNFQYRYRFGANFVDEQVRQVRDTEFPVWCAIQAVNHAGTYRPIFPAASDPMPID